MGESISDFSILSVGLFVYSYVDTTLNVGFMSYLKIKLYSNYFSSGFLGYSSSFEFPYEF